MKPAGPERDKQIDLLRDNKQPIHRPWSTDISCAMELWEEMRKGKDGWVGLPSLISDGESLIDCTVLSRNIIHSHRAETEADAISGAWIKWREGR